MSTTTFTFWMTWSATTFPSHCRSDGRQNVCVCVGGGGGGWILQKTFLLLLLETTALNMNYKHTHTWRHAHLHTGNKLCTLYVTIKISNILGWNKNNWSIVVGRRLGKDKVERTGKAELKKAQFLTTGKAYKSAVWPTLGWEERTFDNPGSASEGTFISGSASEGTFISAPDVPHNGEK